jgi:hypothetical protein
MSIPRWGKSRQIALWHRLNGSLKRVIMMVASLSHRRPVVGNVSSQVCATSPHIASPRPFPCPPWREMARASPQRTAGAFTHVRLRYSPPGPLGVCEGGGPGPRTGYGARKFVNSIAYHLNRRAIRVGKKPGMLSIDLRHHIRIAAGRSGRRDDRRPAAADRWHGNAGIDAGRRTYHALRLRKLLAQAAASGCLR